MADYVPAIEPAVLYMAHGETLEKRLEFYEQARSMLKEQLAILGFDEDGIKEELFYLESAFRKIDEKLPPPRPKTRRIRLEMARDDAHAAEKREAYKRKRAEAALTPLKLLAQFSIQDKLPTLTLPSMLQVGDRTREGELILAVRIPWLRILEIFRRNPEAIYEIDPRKWEEIIAGAYKEAGFDHVELTPRSGDKGRDVVATKTGLGSIRIFDQVKAYRPGTIVTADDVRSLVGTITMAGNVSKGVITTTSKFAPRLEADEYIAGFIPYRVELRDRDALLPWLLDLAAKKTTGGS
jgi:restriction system protein